MATCFSEFPHRAFWSDYSSFGTRVFDGRWGTVLEAIAWLLPLESSLSEAWSLAKYQLCGDIAGHVKKSGKPVKLDVVDSAIKSPMFWAYARLVDRLGETLGSIAKLSEDCPCHSEVPKLDSSIAWGKH